MKRHGFKHLSSFDAIAIDIAAEKIGQFTRTLRTNDDQVCDWPEGLNGLQFQEGTGDDSFAFYCEDHENRAFRALFDYLVFFSSLTSTDLTQPTSPFWVLTMYHSLPPSL